LLTRLQQKSKPRNGAREIFVVTRGETMQRTSSLPRLDWHARQEHAQNGDKIDAAQRSKTTTLSMAQTLADEPVGFEPVSNPNSLLTGKLTGNFAKSGPSPVILTSRQRVNSMASGQIPYATEQGIPKRVSGKIFEGTGNRHAGIVSVHLFARLFAPAERDLLSLALQE
jgi:hypothetical protein